MTTLDEHAAPDMHASRLTTAPQADGPDLLARIREAHWRLDGIMRQIDSLHRRRTRLMAEIDLMHAEHRQVTARRNEIFGVVGPACDTPAEFDEQFEGGRR